MVHTFSHAWEDSDGCYFAQIHMTKLSVVGNRLLFIAFHRIKQTGVSNLSGQNPGAASSLDEVFLSLVRLRRDGSASVFWKDKLKTPVYLNI